MIHQPVPSSSGTKKATSIEKFLEWAFGHEKAELEPPKDRGPIPGPSGYRSFQEALIEIAILGCRIDKSTRGATFLAGDHVHWDAESVAGVIRGMIDAGLMEPRDAHALIDHARAGSRPSWMEGVVPRVVPRPHPETPHDPDSGWRWEKNGGRMGRDEPVPASEVRRWPLPPGVRVDRQRPTTFIVFNPETGRKGRVDCKVCPISFFPTAQQIATAREAYTRWWIALHALREMLVEGQICGRSC